MHMICFICTETIKTCGCCGQLEMRRKGYLCDMCTLCLQDDSSSIVGCTSGFYQCEM